MDSPLNPLLLYPALLLSAFFAGTVDTMAGGGGLITLPILMGLGYSPLEALSTNKFQSSFGSGSATFHFTRAGAISFRECWQGILYTAAGAASGAYAVTKIPSGFLKLLIPWLLLASFFYLLLSPNLGREEKKPRMSTGSFYLLCGLSIGFYDGFFGPGTGSFWVLAHMLLLGLEIKKGTAATKLMNFTSNLVSLAVFLVAGKVQYLPGLVMAAGQFAGGRLGTRLVMTRGAKLIRPVFMAMMAILAIKLFWDSYL